MANITYPYESLTWASYIIGAVALVICVISIMAVWKIYKKAGEHGWACIIPFYSNYVYYRITLKRGWLFFVPLMSSIGAIAATIPLLIAIKFEENAAFLFFLFATLICCITTFVFHIITTYKFSYNFGHGIGFFFGLLFLPIIFYMILGFGQSQYTPPAGYPRATTQKQPNANE